ncbi:MAG: thioesterase family protein [Nostocoides sp.]
MTTPSIDGVRVLPLAYERVVPEHFTDANGHMNIVRYMQVHNSAAWNYLGRFGLGKDDARQGRAGIFDIEHHVRYLREIHVGDHVAVHTRLLARSDKGLHAMQFLVNMTRNELANTLEWVSLSVDMSTRRSAPFPPNVGALLDAQLLIDQALNWPVPAAGAMGLS